jgi:hypothetical protein
MIYLKHINITYLTSTCVSQSVVSLDKYLDKISMADEALKTRPITGDTWSDGKPSAKIPTADITKKQSNVNH